MQQKMEINTIEIKQAPAVTTTEELSVANGCIAAGSCSVYDNYTTVSGVCTNAQSFYNGEPVEVRCMGLSTNCQLYLKDNKFIVNVGKIHSEQTLDVAAYRDVAYVAYNEGKLYEIIDSGSTRFDVRELDIDTRPYIEVDDEIIHFDIQVDADASSYVTINNYNYDVVIRHESGLFGDTLHVTSRGGMLGYNEGDVIYAYIYGQHKVPVDIEMGGAAVNVLGRTYNIIEDISHFVVRNNEEIEIFHDHDDIWSVRGDDSVTYHLNDDLSEAKEYVVDNAGVISVNTYPVSGYSGFEIGGMTYLIKDDAVEMYNRLVGAFIVLNRESDYSAELALFIDENHYEEYTHGDKKDVARALCSFIVTNQDIIVFKKSERIFGNEDMFDNVTAAVEATLSIRHTLGGYTIPVLFNQHPEHNLCQADFIKHQYEDIAIEEELNKPANRIIDMERDFYIPAYKPSGQAYGEHSDSGFSPVTEIRFNLHFRTRTLDDWRVIVDDKTPGTIGNCNWFVTDYYDAQKMIMLKDNGSQHTNLYNNLDEKLYKSSDLLGFLGFETGDVKNRRKKLSKSFIRLMFYDSANPANQTLMYSTTIFVNINKLNGAFMRNNEGKNMFTDAEEGGEGYIAYRNNKTYFYDKRITASVVSCTSSYITVKYNSKTIPLYTAGDSIYIRTASSSSAINGYGFTLNSESDIDYGERTIKFTGHAETIAAGTTVYVYRETDVTDPNNDYLYNNSCGVFSEPCEYITESGKRYYYPTLDKENRLSSQFLTTHNSVIDQSSDGFYMYLFKDYGEKLHVKDLFMKVEFNHAGYGETIPFMILTDPTTGNELTKMSQITDDIKSGYEIYDSYKNMYIPVSVVYDTKLGKYVWYYKNNHSNVLNFNLFEVKYKSVKVSGGDCGLELDSYGHSTTEAAGNVTVNVSGIQGTQGVTGTTDSSWLHVTKNSNSRFTVSFDAMTGFNKWADDETLKLSRTGTVTIGEVDSKYRDCTCEFNVTQTLTNYIFVSRPYHKENGVKIYEPGTTSFTLNSGIRDYFMDVLTDATTFTKSTQSGDSGNFTVVPNGVSKPITVTCNPNYGVKRQTTYAFSIGRSGVHNQATVTLVQEAQTNLFHIEPDGHNAFRFGNRAGTSTYHISSSTPVARPTLVTGVNWGTIASYTDVTQPGQGDDTIYEYDMVISYTDNGDGVHDIDGRTGTLTFIVNSKEIKYNVVQDGFREPRFDMDYTTPEFFVDEALTRQDTSKHEFENVTLHTLGRGADITLPLDDEYWITLTALTSFDTVGITTDRNTEGISMDVRTTQMGNGNYRLEAIIHVESLPFSHELRPAHGIWEHITTGGAIGKDVYLKPGEWADVYGAFYVARFYDGLEYEYVPMTKDTTSGLYHAAYSGDLFTSCCFMVCAGQFNARFPETNVLEKTGEQTVFAGGNTFKITSGYRNVTYTLYNTLDEENETTYETIKLMQPNRRYLSIDPTLDDIIFTSRGGKQTYTIHAEPAGYFVALFCGDDCGLTTMYGGTSGTKTYVKVPANGEVKVIVEAIENFVGYDVTGDAAILLKRHTSNTDAITSAEFEVTVPKQQYLCTLDYQGTSCVTMNFANMHVTNINSQRVSSNDDTFSASSDIPCVDYTLDTSKQEVTLFLIPGTRDTFITTLKSGKTERTFDVAYSYHARFEEEDTYFANGIKLTIKT